jgi:hypothetical protein
MRLRLLLPLLILGVAFVSFPTAATAIPPDPPTITPAQPNPTNATYASFTFDEQGGFTYKCALDPVDPLDSGSFEACTSPKVYGTDGKPLADGSHTFQVEATDPNPSNGTGPPATYTWVVDTIPPQTTITGWPSPSSHSGAFEFASNEPGSTFTCLLDGDGVTSPSPCTSPVTYDGLAEGPHTFQVQATDAATNVGSALLYSWSVDSIAPDLTMSDAPLLLTGNDAATFVFGSSDGGVGYQCSLDDGVFASCSSPAAFEGLTDGTHTFRVAAVDAAGNVGGPLVYTWTVDTTPPDGVSALRAHVSYRRTTLVWQLPANPDFDHVTLFVRAPRSTKAVAAYTGTGTRYRLLKLDNSRTYRYSVVSYDSLGNASGAVTVAIPPSSLLLAPRPGARVGRSPAFEWSPAPGARFYNVQLYRNGRKVLSTWPRSSRLRLPARWSYGGRAHHLARGWYDWYVWPRFGRGSSAHYGALLGSSSFRVK